MQGSGLEEPALDPGLEGPGLEGPGLEGPELASPAGQQLREAHQVGP